MAEARLSDFRAESPPRARYMFELLEGEAGAGQREIYRGSCGFKYVYVLFSFGLKPSFGKINDHFKCKIKRDVNIPLENMCMYNHVYVYLCILEFERIT